jgi:hypothetical protein
MSIARCSFIPIGLAADRFGATTASSAVWLASTLGAGGVPPHHGLAWRVHRVIAVLDRAAPRFRS